jgi:hypothetical protein
MLAPPSSDMAVTSGNARAPVDSNPARSFINCAEAVAPKLPTAPVSPDRWRPSLRRGRRCPSRSRLGSGRTRPGSISPGPGCGTRPVRPGVRRLEETLLAAGKGSRAAVVVFRPGRASADRYQVANHDERIEWTMTNRRVVYRTRLALLRRAVRRTAAAHAEQSADSR